MLLRFFAVIAGFALQTGAIFGMEWLSGKLHPPPPGMDFHDPAQVAAWIARLPGSAFALVLAGYLIGAFLGAHTATEVMGGKSPWPGRIVMALGLAGLALNVVAIPHPAWFITAAAFCFVIGGLSGLRLGGWKGAPPA
jgi:hypothetical protein